MGRYLLTHKLGRGGMGVVWSAIDPELDRRVAIKLLRRSKSKARARSRLLREAQAMARLDHSHVVSVFDVGTVGSRVFVAMEHLGGGTLAQWMQHPRDWREVVAIFRQAGAGLAAAHRAGLTHRDFKPENVLLTDEGIAKVTDFGLVRADDSEDLSADEDELSRSGDAGVSSSALSTPLTQVGAQIGTPAYMAPELFLGQLADARSDQFAFCVSLHEALWGSRPYSGHTLETLRKAVVEDQRLPRSRVHEVPAWLAAIVERGLGSRPEQRFESMDALLAALADDPTRRQRAWSVVAGGLVVLSLLGLGAWAYEQREHERCVATGAAVSELWSPAVAEEIGAAMEATGAEYAGETVARVRARLDDWSQSWSSAREAACEAGRRGPELERESAAATRACLERELDELIGLVELLRDSDRLSLAYADEAAAGLPATQRCQDPLWLAQLNEAGSDAGALEQTRELARTRALYGAGRYADARGGIRALLADDQHLPTALTLEAHLLAGRIELALGRYADAEAEVEQALFGALAADLPRLGFDASAALAGIARRRADFPRARLWVSALESLATRLGDLPEQRIELHGQRAALAQSLREFDEAEAELSLALRLSEKHRPAGHPSIATLQMRLGGLKDLRSDYAGAIELLELARAQWVSTVGEGHPRVASLDHKLAEAERNAGRFEVAQQRLEEVIEVQTQTLGRKHVDVAESLRALAITHAMQGDMPRAVELQRESTEIIEGVFGPEHPSMATHLSNLGTMLNGVGKTEEARAALERSWAIQREVYGPNSVQASDTRYLIGAILANQDEFELAIEHMQAALRGRLATDGEAHERTIVVRTGLGTALCMAGRHEEGSAAQRRGLEAMTQLRGPEHPQLGQAINSIITCERDGEFGDPEEQREMLERALELRSKQSPADTVRPNILVHLGSLHLEHGRLAEAQGVVDRAREVLDDIPRPALRAKLRWLIAKTELTAGERVAAESSSAVAVAELRESEGADSELFAEIEAWRAAQGWKS